MSVDHVEGPVSSVSAMTGLEGTGLALTQFGSAALIGGGESISSASTVRRAEGEQPSVSFTFGSGIAATEPSIFTIHSNLPFTYTPPGPTFIEPVLPAQLTSLTPGEASTSAMDSNQTELDNRTEEKEGEP